MSKVELTVRQIIDLGLWEKVCDYKGWDYYILNEGRISEDELVEFDSTFPEEKDYEFSVNMHMYMQCEESQSLDELEEKFDKLISKFARENKLDFTIHETEINKI